MKTRTGFVSNSSSSSFIIKIGDLTVDQIDRLSQEDWLIIRDGLIQSIGEFDTDESRHYLEHLGIDMKLVKWTCVDVAALLRGRDR